MSDLGQFYPDNLIGGDKKLVTENVEVQVGSNLVRGTVLGRVKQSTPTSGTLAGTGDGTCTLVSGGKNTIAGSYLITCVVLPVTHGGTFRVTNPNGDEIGFFTMPDTAGGTYAFVSDEISFTLTDGATNFDLTSVFTVTVSSGVPTTGTADGGNTGNGTCTGVDSRYGLKVGVYTLTCITAVANAGVFSVVDPDGNYLPNATVAVAYESDEIAFTLNDGSTDFVVGDIFTITTTIGPREVVACDATATDGSSAPYAILSEDVDASSAALPAIAYLEGQFNERRVTLASGTTVDMVRDAARDVGIIFVSSVPTGTE